MESTTTSLTKAASGATAANLRSFFHGPKVLKLLIRLLTVTLPLSVGSKLELLSELSLC